MTNQAKKDPGTELSDLDLETVAGGNGGMPVQSKDDLMSIMSAVRTKIDSAATTQQTEMLRLQSLSSKVNESYDLMSSFMKKLNDMQRSIIRNI